MTNDFAEYIGHLLIQDKLNRVRSIVTVVNAQSIPVCTLEVYFSVEEYNKWEEGRELQHKEAERKQAIIATAGFDQKLTEIRKQMDQEENINAR